ncbi:SPOR domain-containing protein [Parerythrobacter lacustris]|uniref:SPOR domain-containing protein n=1 Tax=Parerythrobacter lacustris TaxID=2969984 RepID=A0ABT1XQA0_9SPHN|nr:SPOR domain-containing protein [Parerythrobacter lacustris]MCR2833816.1 SPOR domain-containing protein [Parerythrobacter lacustris]
MRLPRDPYSRLAVIGLSLALVACGRGGNDLAELGSASTSVAGEAFGPAADYPVVLGDPYTVDGQVFTPFDTMNYDEVGYAAYDANGADGITASHKTLPLPSYVEVTALDTGRTTLVRVERRGPMTGSRLLALSPAASAQLGIAEGAPIRVRRVNPPEDDRAMLRAGAAAPERMETPASLLAVLKRKLPGNGSTSLAVAPPATNAGAVAVGAIAQPAAIEPAPSRVAVAPSTAQRFDATMSQSRSAVKAYPLPPLSGVSRVQSPASVRAAAPETVSPQAPARVAAVNPASRDGAFVVQAAAFSQQANARRAADAVGGFVEKSGSLYRVRIGPFASRGQAEAALAKARAAGYSDARVYPTG